MRKGITAWLRSVTGERHGYVKGYRQALKDVWSIKGEDVRWCMTTCPYNKKSECTVINDDFLKCPKIKKIYQEG